MIMEPSSVSISFNEGSYDEIQGTSGIKITNNIILTSGILLSNESSKNPEVQNFIRNLKPGILTYPKDNIFSNIRLRVTSSVCNRKPRTCVETSVDDFKVSFMHGRIYGIWRCPLLTETLENLLFGWSFDDNTRNKNKGLLTLFLLIHQYNDEIKFKEIEIVDNAKHSLNHLYSICMNEDSSRGTSVFIESTPFGNPVFIDSISRGIVSNVVGKNKCIMLTDANAVPGCEGGPVYVTGQNGSRILCGMVIAPLSWCRGEWVDYTFVARLLPCLKMLLNKPENIEKFTTHENAVIRRGEKIIELLDESVVLLRCGSDWGSGIVLDRNGTVLTCSHVVKEAPERRIKVVIRCNGDENSSTITSTWAKLVYRTPRGQPYDVAILSINTRIIDHTLRPMTIASRAAETANSEGDVRLDLISTKFHGLHKTNLGEAVIIAGFPLFSSTLPTITRGNISRATKCMLQTTCCVQSGASGGPVVRIETGELLGMVVCNVITSRTLYPRLNMAVPMTAIEGPIAAYIKTGNVDALAALTNREDGVHDAWNFHLPSKI